MKLYRHDNRNPCLQSRIILYRNDNTSPSSHGCDGSCSNLVPIVLSNPKAIANFPLYLWIHFPFFFFSSLDFPPHRPSFSSDTHPGEREENSRPYAEATVPGLDPPEAYHRADALDIGSCGRVWHLLSCLFSGKSSLVVVFGVANSFHWIGTYSELNTCLYECKALTIRGNKIVEVE